MKQFGKILEFELMSYFKNKVFVGITLFLVIAIAVVMFFPRAAELFRQEEGDAPEEEREILLLQAETPEMGELLLQNFAAAFGEHEVRLTQDGEEALRQQILSGEAACAFAVTADGSYTYYVENLSMTDTNPQIAAEILRQTAQLQALTGSGMTPEAAAEVLTMEIEGQVVSLGKNQVTNFFYTYIMIFALYMVILLYGQMVATNVATEKSSRAMEVLITSAKPTSMMFGKVLASCLAGLLQLTAVFGSALLFYRLNRDFWGGNAVIESIFAIPPELLVYMLVFFVLGFLLYAFLFGAVGSTASKLEDINTSVMPIVMLFVAAFFVVMFSMTSGDMETPLMIACSYIPFTSPMSMFTRIAMSTVPWYEIAASIGVLVIFTAGVGVLSARIYRVGVLLYGTPPKLAALLKAALKK